MSLIIKENLIPIFIASVITAGAFLFERAIENSMAISSLQKQIDEVQVSQRKLVELIMRSRNNYENKH